MCKKEELVEGIDYVKCKICGAEMKWIQNKHLSKHGLTAKEYRAKFPGAKTKCDKMTKKLVDTRVTVKVTKVCDREGCENLCSTNHNKYCSYSCSNLVTKNTDSNLFKNPETNPSYKNGSYANWKKARKERAELDNHTCQCCHKEGLDGKKLKYGVHHLIPKKFFEIKELNLRDSIKNTITLCNSCHREIEAKSFYWTIELVLNKKGLSKEELMNYLRGKIENYYSN